MWGINFEIQNWCAYVPADDQLSLSDQIPLLDEDRAQDVSFLPPLSRRRLSRLSKLSLRLAHEVQPEYRGYCVFGSQHGELVTTQSLLEAIVQGDLVSPAGFSASVHNTAAGLHSIQNKNEYPVTSLAAGLDTLVMCFAEASTILQNELTDEVLVVFADDAIPECYSAYIDYPNQLHGFAALVRRPSSANAIKVNTSTLTQTQNSADQISQLIKFLSEPLNGHSMLMRGEAAAWRWQHYA